MKVKTHDLTKGQQRLLNDEITGQEGHVRKMMTNAAVESLFDNLCDHAAWSVRRTHGSCFFVEFGNPHQKIREPLPVREGMSKARLLKSRRRRISFRGDWSLLVLDCNWSLRAWELSADHDSMPSQMQQPFEALDGQYLKSARYDAASKAIMLTFDLEAQLRLWPRENADPLAEQWSICSIDNVYRSFLGSGEIVVNTGDEV